MSKVIFSAALFIMFLFSESICAQTDSELVNSGGLLDRGQELQDSGRYKEAIELYKKISRSDTNYVKVLHALSSCSNSDSNYEAGIHYAELGLKLFPEEFEDWYFLKAEALDESGRQTEAQAYYDTVIKANPHSYVAWFNKGITFFNLKKYSDAKACFQRTLLIYPFYSAAHYFLGKVYLIEGNLPASLLCFTTTLAINPESKYGARSVGFLSSISEVKDDVAESAAKSKPGRIDNFAIQQEIILGKIALDKHYKLQTDVEDPITRQLQVLFEKLEYNKNDNSFCMQYYVPFYTQLFQQGKFNALVNFMFSGLDIKSVKEFNKRHKKEIDDIVDIDAAYFNGIKETQMLNVDARAAATTHYLFENGVITGKGAWKDANKDKLLYGPWEFYYSFGQLKSKGVLNDQQNKEGDWFFYYRNGQMKEHSFFSNDSLNGKSTYWFDNGNISSEVNYINGKEDGEKRKYYYNALLKTVEQYVNGKKNGIARGYKVTGELDYVTNYKDDAEDGAETYYYSNGKILSQANYVTGKADGPYKKFNADGVLIMEGAYQQDKPAGAWKTWYPSAKPKEEYVYLDGELTGELKEYYENGRLMEHIPYAGGKEEGKEEYFGEDGKLISESYYEKGRLRELKFYDKEGKVISNTTTRNGAGGLSFFNEYGNKLSDGNFTKDGQREGKSTYYYSDGKINEVALYSKGSLNGEKVEYYYNGSVSSKLNYTDDKEDGYSTTFYENSKPKYKGWFVDGDKEGEHREYDIAGNVASISYYKNGLEDGYAEYYYPDGKKDYEDFYSEGWITHITQFDSTGKVTEDVDVTKGNTDFVFKHHNGKPLIKSSYRNYHLHGRYDCFYFDGSYYYTLFYNQGRKDSVYKQYYYGGKLEAEGKYQDDEKEGVWNVYYENGKLSSVANYKNGSLQGKSTFYNEDGTKNKENFYKDNDLDGPMYTYGDDNQVAYILNYHDGRLLSYSYEGKDGKPVSEIPLKDEAGTVTAYYKNGTKSVEMAFVNGAIEGIKKMYYSNGKIYTEGLRVGGDLQGQQKKYAINGQLLEDENYYYDNLQGIAKYYYPDGKPKAEENWYNGSRNGGCKYYDENGKLKQTRVYYYDTIESVQ